VVREEESQSYSVKDRDSKIERKERYLRGKSF
jgi:hypothetical protein